MNKKKIVAGMMLGIASLSLASCNEMGNSNSTSIKNNAPSVDVTNASDAEDSYQSITSDFYITSDADSITNENGIYTIRKAGEYTLEGALNEGMVIVSASDSDEVKLILNGVSIHNSTNSGIYIESADKVTINSAEDTYNEIIDTRELKTVDDDSLGSGAIYSTCDLSFIGKGSLVVSSSYNNGIHSKKDVSFKNTTIKVTAVNNAIKGNDSITIKSGNIIAISTGGDGLKTEDSDISSKGNQRGIIDIEDGNVDIYAACDGIDSSYDVIIGTSDTLNLNIYTNSYSEYTGNVSKASDSEFYLRIPSNYYSNQTRYAIYYYDDNGNYEWKSFSLINSSQSFGGMTRPGQTNYYYFKASQSSKYSNFIIYAFSSSQTENSTDTYSAKTNGQSVNSIKDMYAISYISNKLISGDFATYTATSNQGFGMEQGNTNKSEYSSKGIKAANEVSIKSGNIHIEATDDGIHTNNDSTLENGESPLGNIVIDGGTISIISADDGMHADDTLTINGGVINIEEAYEGLEANLIEFKGGTTYVIASDDGINAAACGKTTTPLIDVSGGYIDVTVGTGDVDGIDSNGNYTQTGGFVITRDKTTDTSGNASGLDIDGTCTINGGTFICVGSIAELPSSSSKNPYVRFGSSSGMGGGMFGRPGSNQTSSSSVSFTAGTYTISNTTISFVLNNSYNNMWISSDEFSIGTSYTLTNGSTTKTWSQSQSAVTSNN